MSLLPLDDLCMHQPMLLEATWSQRGLQQAQLSAGVFPWFGPSPRALRWMRQGSLLATACSALFFMRRACLCAAFAFCSTLHSYICYNSLASVHWESCKISEPNGEEVNTALTCKQKLCSELHRGR